MCVNGVWGPLRLTHRWLSCEPTRVTMAPLGSVATAGDDVTMPPVACDHTRDPLAAHTPYTLWSADPKYRTPLGPMAGDDVTDPPVPYAHCGTPVDCSRATNDPADVPTYRRGGERDGGDRQGDDDRTAPRERAHSWPPLVTLMAYMKPSVDDTNATVPSGVRTGEEVTAARVVTCQRATPVPVSTPYTLRSCEATTSVLYAPMAGEADTGPLVPNRHRGVPPREALIADTPPSELPKYTFPVRSRHAEDATVPLVVNDHWACTAAAGPGYTDAPVCWPFCPNCGHGGDADGDGVSVGDSLIVADTVGVDDTVGVVDMDTVTVSVAEGVGVVDTMMKPTTPLTIAAVRIAATTLLCLILLAVGHTGSGGQICGWGRDECIVGRPTTPTNHAVNASGNRPLPG